MRPIKYRAWDKTEKKMYDLRDMYFNVSIDHPRVVFEMPFEMVDEDWKDHDLVLLAFTGLTDRNGTEIYEGDIRKVGTGRLNDLFVVTWYEKTARFNFQSLFSGATLTFDNDWNDFAKESEKVGTIFENPELVDKDMTLNVWGNING